MEGKHVDHDVHSLEEVRRIASSISLSPYNHVVGFMGGHSPYITDISVQNMMQNALTGVFTFATAATIGIGAMIWADNRRRAARRAKNEPEWNLNSETNQDNEDRTKSLSRSGSAGNDFLGFEDLGSEFDISDDDAPNSDGGSVHLDEEPGRAKKVDSDDDGDGDVDINKLDMSKLLSAGRDSNVQTNRRRANKNYEEYDLADKDKGDDADKVSEGGSDYGLM